MDQERKPQLSIGQILSMNLGFLGLQFSFGLQQGNMGPIYSFLGAEESQLPLLQLAGPITGLVIQPIVGALSDRTLSRHGRRTPYFLIGAIMCAVGLFFMPLSASIMSAMAWLWILDAGNNTTMEPYRAYVTDRLNPDQRQAGFLTQSAFTGLAQMRGLRGPTDRSDKARARIVSDLYYVDNFSLWLDIKIMVGTVISELRGGKGF